MAGKEIKAGLKITADTAQAAKAVRDLGKDVAATTAATTGGTAAPTAPGKAPFKPVVDGATEASKKVRQTTRDVQMLMPQITDIVTGLASGQSPLMVLVQQGGQLRDVFGGFGNVFRVLGAIITPARLAFGGLAAAIGTVAFAAIQGSREGAELRKTFALTGNAAGVTAGEIDELARSIADQQRAAIGDVRETLAEVVASGQFTGETLASVARAVVAVNKLTGGSAGETLKQFTALETGVAAGAAKLNRQYNFLTVEQYKLVRSLEAQGKQQEAVKLVTEQLASTLETRGVAAVGGFERAWNGLKNTLSDVWETLKAIGRPETLEQQLAAAEKRVERAKQRAAEPASIGPYGGPRPSGKDALAQAELVRDALASDLRQFNSNEEARAAAARETNQKIKREEKSYQDALGQIGLAGIDKRVAQEMAALDRRQSALDQARAADVMAERDYSARLNAIEVERLQAQRRALEQRLALERGKLVPGGDTPEQKAQEARVTQLEGQLVEMRSRIAQAAAKGVNQATAAGLADAREQAQQWADVWQRAQQGITQFADAVAEEQARRMSDPLARAQAEARAATAELRRDFEALQRDLSRAITPGMDPERKALLEQQLRELRQLGESQIGARERQAVFGSLQSQLAAQMAELQAKEQDIARRVAVGETGEAAGERELLDLRREQVPLLDRILELLTAIADTQDERAVVAGLRNAVKEQADFRTELEKTARSAAIGSLSTALTDIATGAKKGKEALLDMVGGFARAMLDVLNRRLAEQLVDSFTKAGSGAAGGGFLSGVAGFFSSLLHSGGVVGAPGGQQRAVNPLAFAAAPRYHSGNTGDLMRGMGLRPGERAAILEDGEEVLTADNPRHVRNFRGAGGVSIQNIVTINGAGGDEASMRASVDDLQRMQEDAFSRWAVNQMRPGGLLSGR